MDERREQPQPVDAESYLRQLPSLALLERLPVATLGVARGGDIAYANPALAELLGHADGATVAQFDLPRLLRGHETRTPADCLTTLRMASSTVEWNHNHGYVVRTMVSKPLLLRTSDTLLLIGITDVTAWLWESGC